ncbi:MAG: hypothetical protein MUO26_09620 [Methanotrichaceae archaeon]|nr:hypothetical protein [Methanotrichaceae archaeon]
MTATIIDDRKLRNKSFVFQDREDAGIYLALTLERFKGKDVLVFAIPSGGVPVGLVIASHLEFPFDLLIKRKIPIPGNPEAGLGAMNLEGDIILNDRLISMLGISIEDIQKLAEPIKAELQTRNLIFRGDRPWPEINGKIIILADDGLASGYTMITAARMVRRYDPEEIVVAVPTGAADAVKLLAKEVDIIYCPNIREGYSFAVADAYRDWYDLSKEEVVDLLMKHNFLTGD